jgi:hypothetical protein
LVQRYASFLVRWWQLDGDTRRFTIEHVATGERTVVTTFALAVAWMESRLAQADPAEQAGPAEESGSET